MKKNELNNGKETILKNCDYSLTIDEAGTHEAIKQDGTVERTIVATISDASVDRVNDRVLPGAFINLDKQVPFLWGHNRDELPLGKTIWNKYLTSRKAIKSKLQFAPTAKGLEAYELVKGGFINTVSVGMRMLEYYNNDVGGKDIKQAELLEVSLVNIPANRNAVIEGVKSLQSKGIGFTESTLAEFDIEVTPDPLDYIDDMVEEHNANNDNSWARIRQLIDDIKNGLKKLETEMLTNSESNGDHVEESGEVAATSDDTDDAVDETESTDSVEESGDPTATSDVTESNEDVYIIEGDETNERDTQDNKE